MKERPILFSGPMVRALLASTKTQTRRLCKKQPYANWYKFDGCDFLCHNDYLPPSAMLMDGGSGKLRYTTSNVEGWESECPYGQPGDRLWVRETTRSYYLPNFLTGEPTNALCGKYVADGEPVLNEDQFDFAWWYSRKSCPAIHMPRWASRITLEITGVRVERLQEISEADAKAEGIGPHRKGGWWWEQPPDGIEGTNHFGAKTARDAYRALWESINGGGSWAANPWVWVVGFERIGRSALDGRQSSTHTAETGEGKP